MVALPSPAAFEHKLMAYRRIWRGSVLMTFGMPILFLSSLGWSVGAQIDRRGLLDVPYLEYIAPGLLVNSALQVAVSEMMAPVLGSVMWSRIFHAMRAAPMAVPDIVAGHLGYVLLRSGLGAVGFTIVMAAFGLLHSVWAVLLVPIALLVAAAGSLPVFAYSVRLRYEGNFQLIQRFAVIPMTLFAGVFFPVSVMPLPARLLAYASPLWHGVELSRSAASGVGFGWLTAVHVLYLAAWAGVGFWLGCRGLARRLCD